MLFEMLAKNLVIFGRNHLRKPVSRDFLCQGRPWLVPTFFSNCSCERARRRESQAMVKKADACVHFKGTTRKLKIRSIRRAGGTGYPGCALGEQTALLRLLVRMHGGWADGRHDFAQCREIEIDPVNSVPPTPTTHGCFRFGSTETCRESCCRACACHMETNSDETPIWLVKVSQPAMVVFQ